MLAEFCEASLPVMKNFNYIFYYVFFVCHYDRYPPYA